MSAKEYIDQINKLSLHDKMLIMKSLQESIVQETSPEIVDPVILEIIVQRQNDLKSGLVAARPWDEIKKELLK